MYTIKRIENITWEILKELDIKSLPIPIKQVAVESGIQIKPYDLGQDVSGVLLVKNGEGIIGYNPSDSEVRQRFTIAHELGHYVLHRTKGELFIDKQFQVHFRNQESSTGENRQEMEANAFAAAILMPQQLVSEQIRKRQADFADENIIKELSRLFNVSLQAMVFRISNLNLY